MIILNVLMMVATIALVLGIGIVCATAFMALCEDVYNLIKK